MWCLNFFYTSLSKPCICLAPPFPFPLLIFWRNPPVYVIHGVYLRSWSFEQSLLHTRSSSWSSHENSTRRRMGSCSPNINNVQLNTNNVQLTTDMWRGRGSKHGSLQIGSIIHFILSVTLRLSRIREEKWTRKAEVKCRVLGLLAVCTASIRFDSDRLVSGENMNSFGF